MSLQGLSQSENKVREKETIVRFRSPIDGHIECRYFTTTEDRAKFILSNWNNIVEEDR